MSKCIAQIPCRIKNLTALNSCEIFQMTCPHKLKSAKLIYLRLAAFKTTHLFVTIHSNVRWVQREMFSHLCEMLEKEVYLQHTTTLEVSCEPTAHNRMTSWLHHAQEKKFGTSIQISKEPSLRSLKPKSGYINISNDSRMTMQYNEQLNECFTSQSCTWVVLCLFFLKSSTEKFFIFFLNVLRK